MNGQKNTDFFYEISEQDRHQVRPKIYRLFRETEEERFHEKRLSEIEDRKGGKFGNYSSSPADDELGELLYDAEADRKRWDELERDFDRVFDEAEKPYS